MNRLICLGVALCIVVLTAPAFAGPLIASGSAVTAPVGSDFDYTITLTNSSASTVSLGTFWFAWVPGEDFMPDKPISESAPSGWLTNQITHGALNDGYAIRWVANGSGNDLAPGQSLEFGFVSPDSPTVLSGDSSFYPGTPIGTSFVYQNGPFQGDSDQFVVSFASVPEPSSVLLGIIAAAASFACPRLGRKRAH